MQKKILVLAIATQLGLSACVPAVIVGAGVAGGTAIAKDSRTMQVISNDNELAHQANSRLQANKALADTANVTASAYNGLLLLVGQAPNAQLRTQAEDLVKKLPNLRHVYNEITIGQPIGGMTSSDDAMLTSNIKTRMMGMSDVTTSQFSVVTENGVVYLLGLSTRDSTDLVAKMISRRPGVKKVVKLVEYIPEERK